MELNSYFVDFLSEIRLTDNQRSDLITGHTTLRKRLLEDVHLSTAIVSTFLQGSYRRATAIRPKGDKRSDVDIIVVTKLAQEDFPNPEKAIELFIPFMDKHYPGKYSLQGRSIGISLSYVDLDLVITAAPSVSEQGILKSESVTTANTPEDVDDWRMVKSWIALENRGNANYAMKALRAAAEEPEWKLSALLIPDREAKKWQPTHPLEQMRWTSNKNRQTNGHYVNVVKAIKWWRRVCHSTPKYPKGYPVEHLVGQNCPDNICSVAEGVTRVLEGIVKAYGLNAALKQTPKLPDHGVPEHNVFLRVSGEDFAEFYDQVGKAAAIARSAYDSTDLGESVSLWKQLFGDKFPDPPIDNSGKGGTKSSGFTPREKVSVIGGGRFA